MSRVLWVLNLKLIFTDFKRLLLTSLPAVLLLSIATNDLLIRTKLLRWLVCCNRLLNKAQKGWRVSNIQSFCNSLPDRPSGILILSKVQLHQKNLHLSFFEVDKYYMVLQPPLNGTWNLHFIEDHVGVIFTRPSQGPAVPQHDHDPLIGETPSSTPVPAIEKVFHGPYGSKPGSVLKGGIRWFGWTVHLLWLKIWYVCERMTVQKWRTYFWFGGDVCFLGVCFVLVRVRKIRVFCLRVMISMEYNNLKRTSWSRGEIHLSFPWLLVSAWQSYTPKN